MFPSSHALKLAHPTWLADLKLKENCDLWFCVWAQPERETSRCGRGCKAAKALVSLCQEERKHTGLCGSLQWAMDGICLHGCFALVFDWAEPNVAGNGRRRSISCPSCNGQAEGNKLLAPLALACGADGSVFVGDFNYIRRIFPSGNVTSVMELR